MGNAREGKGLRWVIILAGVVLLGLVAGARALALLRGRTYALPQDVYDVAPDVLRHRLVLSYEALAQGLTVDQLLTRLLMLWTLTIVFLPFPTALVAGPKGAGGQAVTQLLYVGTMTLSSFLLGLVCLVLARHPELRESQESPDALHAFATATAFGVALAVMLLVPSVSYWPLLLLLASDRVVDLVRRRTVTS